MIRLFLALTFISLPLLHAQEKPKNGSAIYRSVLRIEVATQTPDYSTPWNSGRFSGGIGTGFIVGENQILTNAHVVSNQQRILATVHGSPKKYPAKVEHIAHDCDLALLSLEDFSDFKEFPVFSFGDVPQLESEVTVIGYPVGGSRLSVTKGIVSRIDFQPYSHSRSDSHLVVQIDAAINPGNSGGPVLQDGKVVGVAFQGLRQADNTGYIIPTPVVKRFVKDIEDGKYDFYAELGISEFPLHNPAMRKALGLPNNDMGVLITKVTPTSSADGLLKAGDILISLDGSQVDSAGQVLIDGEKVNLAEIVERKFTGDKVSAKVLRDGKELEVDMTLKTLPAAQMYTIRYETKPRYIVFAGLVFQPLDTNLFATSKFTDITVRRLYSDYVSKGIFQEKKDIVILTQIQPDSVTSQMEDFTGLAVDKINGIPVTSLKHAHELLYSEDPPEFHTIQLHGGTRPLVVPSAEVKAANGRVQENYSVSKLFNLEE
jgi:S1-C subfamily serine protease